jgi:hypothetical protein
MKLGTAELARVLLAQVPVETPTYKPIAHSIIIDSVKEYCYKNDVAIFQEDYLANQKGTQVVGRYTLGLEEGGLQMQIAFKNSYDRTMSLGFAAGATVFVCQNGVVRGEIAYKRKHQGNIQAELNDNLNNTYDKLDQELEQIVKDFALLRNREVVAAKLYELIGRMYMEEDILNTEQLQIVKRESQHSEHFTGNSAYDLYNWVTESLKKSHPANYLEKHSRLHTLFLNEFE